MRYSPVLFLLFFVGPILYGQNEVYDAIKKLPVNDSVKMMKIDSLLEKNLKDGNLKDLERVSGRYANWLYKRRKLKKALTYLQININHHTGDSLKLQKQLYKAGQFAFFDYNFSTSATFFKEAVAVNPKNQVSGKAHIELGRNYYFLGDYYRSIEYFELGEALLSDLGDFEQLARGYLNSINPYRVLRTDESLSKLYKNLRACDSLIEVHDLSINKRYLIQRAIGLYHNIDLQRRDTIQALAAFEKSLTVAFDMEDSLKIARVYMDMGNLFDVHNFRKSNAYFEQAARYCPKRYPNDLAVISSNVGSNLAKMGDFDDAIAKISESLDLIIGKSVDFRSILSIEKQKILKAHGSERNFWIIMSWLAEAYLLKYETEKDAKSLEESIFYFKLTDETFDFYTQNVNEFNSKLQWRKDASQHYGRALKACFYAQDVESAFFFMEKNKAILLTEAIDKQRTNKSFNLPANVYKLENDLKRSINELENSLEANGANGANVTISENILRKKERLDSYWDSISNLYPNYIPLRTSSILKLNDLQATLKPDEVVISYHLAVDDGAGVYSNTNNGYVLAITKTKTYLQEIPDLPGLKKDVKALTTSLKVPFTTEKSARFYYALSNKLYRALFPSEEIKKELSGRKVAIIADNYLSLLPFEALSVDPQAPAYLIEDSEIRYLYSNSFLENNRQDKIAKNSFLGMAPTQFDELALSTLSNSKLEIEILGKYYSGNALFNEMATRDSFMRKLPEHGIIHLATHADAQDSIAPWIAFYDGKITLEDLYETQNNASLVVLSGCNTTLGKQETGEGVMSLARGFFYSGAQSVMSTLWSIDDKSTATLVSNFYENLADGQTKATALHNAKINYLNTHSLSEASPYYWASFIHLGENNTLPKSRGHWPYYLMFGVGGLLLIAAIRRYRRK